MSEIKYQDFVLSKIGWGVAVIFSLFGYVSYYLWIYPALASVPLRQNVYSKTPIVGPAFEDLSVQVSAPLYLSNFQESLLSISIINDSVDQVIEGKLNLNITGSNLLFDEKRIDEKYVLTFLLEPKEVFTKEFSVKTLNNEDTHVIFTLNFSQIMIRDNTRNDLITIATPTPQVNTSYTVTPEYLVTPIVTSTPLIMTPEISETFDQGNYSDTQVWDGDYPVEWILDGYEWQGNSINKKFGTCEDEINVPEARKTKICAINYPYGSFAESSLSKLLLPPWSGLSSLALVFGVVWLLEQFVLSYGTVKVETLSAEQQRIYTFILLLSGVFLLGSFTFGIIIVFQTITYSPLVYYGVLVILILLSLGCGFIGSWIFKKSKSSFISDSDSVFKLIVDAYEERNLLRLEEIRDSYDKFDVRYKYADSYYKDLEMILLEGYVKGMIAFDKDKDYLLMLQKTESLFRENKCLWYLPDHEHKIEVFRGSKSIKKISSGWIFRNPKESEKAIYFCLIDGLSKLPADELKNRNICEQLIAKFSQAKAENWSDAFKSLENNDQIKELLKPCENQNDNIQIVKSKRSK